MLNRTCSEYFVVLTKIINLWTVCFCRTTVVIIIHYSIRNNFRSVCPNCCSLHFFWKCLLSEKLKSKYKTAKVYMGLIKERNISQSKINKVIIKSLWIYVIRLLKKKGYKQYYTNSKKLKNLSNFKSNFTSLS